jgi:pimeloyl-ACP methyl ester carboxylesterase
MLAQLDIPTLVLCGRTDEVTPMALSREAAALIPGARLHIVEDAGHWTPLEQPDAVADELRVLLERVS